MSSLVLPEDIQIYKSGYEIQEYLGYLKTRKFPQSPSMFSEPVLLKEESAKEFKVLFCKRTVWISNALDFWSPSVEYVGEKPRVIMLESISGTKGEEGLIAKLELSKPCILYIGGITSEAAGTYYRNDKPDGKFPPPISFAEVFLYV